MHDNDQTTMSYGKQNTRHNEATQHDVHDDFNFAASCRPLWMVWLDWHGTSISQSLSLELYVFISFFFLFFCSFQPKKQDQLGFFPFQKAIFFLQGMSYEFFFFIFVCDFFFPQLLQHFDNQRKVNKTS